MRVWFLRVLMAHVQLVSVFIIIVILASTKTGSECSFHLHFPDV
jgi:hypothetical protein